MRTSIRKQKVTVLVPADLLKRATKATGLGLTPTICKGLERVSADWAYDHLLKMQGKLKLDIDLDQLRED